MEGQTQLVCRDCGRRATIAGELPAEYSACFQRVVRRDGWVIAPGHRCDFLCGECLKNYEPEGSESKDDGEKIR